MPRLEFFIVARSFAADKFTNRLSLFDIFETVQPIRFPAVIPRMVAMSAWHYGNAEERQEQFQATVIIKMPEPEEDVIINTNFENPGILHHTVAGVSNTIVSRPGTIEIELKLNGEHQAFHRIQVVEANDKQIDDGSLLYPGSNEQQEAKAE